MPIITVINGELDKKISERVYSELKDSDFDSLDSYFAEVRARTVRYNIEHSEAIRAKESKPFNLITEIKKALPSFNEPESNHRAVIEPVIEITIQRELRLFNNTNVTDYVYDAIHDKIPDDKWQVKPTFKQTLTDMTCPQCGAAVHLKVWSNSNRIMLSCNIGAYNSNCKYGHVIQK